ncbi:hypothetical protein ACQSMD_20605 [Streptomyces flavovirens]|uniref:hypothetical protein n=1 Tax=Streptomyces TaxID=1883 RepID=UPI00081B9366|nr:hypothetical protein [Streptomyces sp. BpilaLS-43]SCD92113.1 hypothetical protein GA0115239_112012 [Streptomyces sp. BpilaLS-43]
MSRPEHRHDDDRTGNGIVNHGPDNTPNTDPEPTAGAGDAGEGDGGPAGAGRPASAGEGAPADGARTPGADTAAGSAAAEEAPDAEADSAEADDADADDADADDADADEPDADDAETDGSSPDSPDGGAADSGGADGGAADSGASSGDGASGGASGGSGPGTGGTLTALFGGAPDATPDDADVDEAALRRMMQGAVRGLQPADGTLDHLHRAVPARRARRRQAVVGAVAAALLIGTAVPAFVHVANSDGSVAANPSIAGHGEQAQGGNGQDAGRDTGGERPTGPEARQNEGTEGEKDPSESPKPSAGTGSDGTGTAGLDDTPGVEVAAMPACAPSQLGVASAESGAPGPDGKVYGSFRISNVSGKPCSVTSNGTVGFQAVGAADPLKITVVQHAAGDAASGLPHPSTEPGAVLLKPAMAYEVRFAWVPSDTCPTTGSSPSPTPTDGDGGGGTGGTAGGSAAGSSDTAAQFGSADDVPVDGSVAVTHTPETGAPTAETTISHACAGTIYRTGVLNAS